MLMLSLVACGPIDADFDTITVRLDDYADRLLDSESGERADGVCDPRAQPFAFATRRGSMHNRDSSDRYLELESDLDDLLIRGAVQFLDPIGVSGILRAGDTTPVEAVAALSCDGDVPPAAGRYVRRPLVRSIEDGETILDEWEEQHVSLVIVVE